MKKHGFTLIELLAVIVILAIIAVIATPIILNVIEYSRKESAKDSAYNIVSAVNTYYTTSQLDSMPATLPLLVSFPDSNILIGGTVPESGSVIIKEEI
ncbi:MAG: prepilin-type N-terminal cleavage/methylation domain-containing protein [Bacilli bacterium]|nr:prepilin-type N-terminal cleavage/methylation domain-containing protein [Bacilli bacterium]